MNRSSWQVRRAKGRRIYTGLSRAQVERALRTGKLTSDDLALPPGAPRWMKITVALVYAGDEAPATAAAPVPAAVTIPEWAPMEQEGRLIRPEPEDEDPAEMDMTPMIDVTTLLLIFFLVGGVFMLQSAIDLPQAKTGTPAAQADIKPVSVMIDHAEQDPAGGVISFEDARDTPVSLDELGQGYRQRVEAGEFLQEVMLKAHRDVPFGLVRQTMAKLTEAGASQIRVGIEEAR